MPRRSTLQIWTAKTLVIVCFLGWSPILAADEPEPAVPNSLIRGVVMGPDGKRLSDVEIIAYHLATEETFTTRTNSRGEFRLAELPYGYFDLALRSADGLYVSDQVANVSPAGRNIVDFRLQDFSGSTQADRRAFPGSDDEPVGVARVLDQRLAGESFWRGPKGISIIAGGGALVLLAIAGGSEPPASQILP